MAGIPPSIRAGSCWEWYVFSNQPSPFVSRRGTAGRSRLPSPEDPRAALEVPDLAWYFHNYITELAKWYDLGDALRQFATKVPEVALDQPLLFSAVIALSAEHLCRTTGPKIARETAAFYHGHCVRRLIQLDGESELLTNGVALAAACLLRSYEILDEDIDPNRHLRGAYSLASCEDSIAGSSPDSLLAAGFWNYLREDITFSLFEGCPLKMDVTESAAPSLANGHDQQLHSISLILGQIINKAFRNGISATDWQQLVGMAHAWLDELPPHVKPYSRGRSVTLSTVGELPSFWFLQDFHASARQYLLVSLSILAVFARPDQLSMLPPVDAGTSIASHAANKEDLLDAYALEICGIAFTTNIAAVIVNSFGPIAYCGKFVRSEPARQEVIRRLAACKRPVGWPVERLISGLQQSWAAAGHSQLRGSPPSSGEAGPSPGAA
ncbi:hypothetical protein BBK36DRAFT_1162864 [Trichoderma citrinoviride]|uniref:Transcription factor domain-containing protein n=1 Tax=Trichoderma citrinoviride TaxID=58853 RepID=A0A2T4AZV7_9HYPO|nr:hypothetical protein BBK36DRAFT_1162864 [Trichoderma citrinoviride]PTB62607.1 hypothetical protein BBK36DRAFT_1162864 [Trichoderma citrinoviride]